MHEERTPSRWALALAPAWAWRSMTGMSEPRLARRSSLLSWLAAGGAKAMKPAGLETEQRKEKEKPMEEKKSGSGGIILIIHALFWAAAMLIGTAIFKDQPWGENLFLWMIVGFTVSNGLLMSALGLSSRGC